MPAGGSLSQRESGFIAGGVPGAVGGQFADIDAGGQ